MLGTSYFWKSQKLVPAKQKKSTISKNEISSHEVLQNCHMRCFYSTDRDPYSLYDN